MLLQMPMFPPWWLRTSFQPPVATNWASNHCQAMAFLSKWPRNSVMSPTMYSSTYRTMSQQPLTKPPTGWYPVQVLQAAPPPPIPTPPHCQPPFMLTAVIRFYGHRPASMSLQTRVSIITQWPHHTKWSVKRIKVNLKVLQMLLPVSKSRIKTLVIWLWLWQDGWEWNQRMLRIFQNPLENWAEILQYVGATWLPWCY